MMNLFSGIVKDVWKQRTAHRERAKHAKQVAKSKVEATKQRLVDLLVAGSIEQAVYADQMKKVGTTLDSLQTGDEQESATATELHNPLEFGEWLLGRVAAIWTSAELLNKVRLQRVLFPDGLKVSSSGFGTAQHPLFFGSYLESAPEGVNWRPQGDSNPRYRRERAMS
jgi:hypothetical protein